MVVLGRSQPFGRTDTHGCRPMASCFLYKRREFITLLGGTLAAWPRVARAQRPAKMLRVGTVAGTPKSSPQWVAFDRRMGELGYQEGKNFSFDFLQAVGADEYEVLYRKLAAQAPDVILAIGPEIGLRSALAATRTLPIVMIAIDYDPLARGYVTSLARPSGNVTGVVFQQIELAAKRIQLIKDNFLDRSTATMFWDQLSADQWEAARSTAAMLGLQLFGIELRGSPYDYEAALSQAPLDHRGMLIVPTSPSFFRDRARLADFALRHRILTMFVFREWVDAGGLLCYGPSITALFARVATIAIEYRWAEGQFDRLPMLAAELVHRSERSPPRPTIIARSS
jgi:putative ABC transport system substrate-binding protein